MIVKNRIFFIEKMFYIGYFSIKSVNVLEYFRMLNELKFFFWVIRGDREKIKRL